MPTDTTPFVSRLERFARVGSTNDVIRGWLAEGTPEVCVGVADEQSAGRGREGRTWTAPPGAALLVSFGFRPASLSPARVWQLAASVALAMASAAEAEAGLTPGTIRLKWPNDLVVVEDAAGGGIRLRKLAGLLGETEGLGTGDPRAIVGIGTNVDWAARDFPADLAGSMTSLRVLAGRPVDREAVLERALIELAGRLDRLRNGEFDARGWIDRQVTTGLLVRLEGPGDRIELVRAAGVDPESGALLVRDLEGPPSDVRSVHAGEITHLRVPSAVAV